MVTETERSTIFDLTREGYSAGRISGQMGLTRNQVIGIVSRARHKGIVLPHNGHKVWGNTKPRAPKIAPPPPDEPEPIGPIGSFPDRGKCLFIRGEMIPEFQACGHPVDGRRSWCEYHHALTTQPTMSRRKVNE
jgi:hypothetical protein